MCINIIAYPPGGGGNHVRNLCDLNGQFRDQWPWEWVQQQRVDLRPYDDPSGQPGEVHSLPGRNIHEVFVEHISKHPDGQYLLQGHFGELAPYSAEIRSWPEVRWLIITMDDVQDRQLLKQRQQRLQYHPYWMDEEQIFLYRPEMYIYFFGALPQRIHQLALRHLWHQDILHSGALDALEMAFDLSIDPYVAQELHNKWCLLNFGATQDQPRS